MLIFAGHGLAIALDNRRRLECVTVLSKNMRHLLLADGINGKAGRLQNS